ncbi:MAG: acyltransferase [Erysipelotrichaceae bacterium]|jgi:surface polysaccharide O-acyltransferase-like enzyme|nr:acyltransferase [Erysipelotrichaceae bacterium]
MKKRYGAVDAMKVIASILVIANHTNPLLPYTKWGNFILINVVCRITVPFFFISAGYFLALKISERGNQYFKPYILSVIKLYLLAFVFYLPFGLYYLPQYLGTEMTPALWAGALVEALILHGSYFHLWYLPALIFSLTVVYLAQKKLSTGWLLLIGVVLFLFGLSETYSDIIARIPYLNTASDFYFKWFVTTRNGVFFGFIFAVIGFDLQKEESLLHLKHPGRLSLLFFVGLLLEASLLRIFTVPLNYNMLLFQVPFSVCFFEYLKSERFDKLKVPYSFNWYFTAFYITHAFFIAVLPLLLAPLHLDDLWNYGWFRFFSVTLLTWGVCWLYQKLKVKKKVKA